MSLEPDQGPGYERLRELKDTQGRELMRRFGAHAIGIGRKRTGGAKTGELALIFYVERKGPAERLGLEEIPASITFTPPDADEPVDVPTDVIESPPAEFE